MSIPSSIIQVGKCYLVEPGGRVRRVVEITRDGYVRYETRNKTAGGGSSKSVVMEGLEKFAREAAGEVPCD
jgi:hypothetical protein